MEWKESGVSLQMDQAFYLADNTAKEDTAKEKTGNEINVEELLSGTGAEGEGGALEQVDAMIKDYGRAGKNLTQTVAVYVFFIVLVISAILVMVHAHNVNKLGDSKSAVGWVILGGVLAFAAGSIVVLAQTIGIKLF